MEINTMVSWPKNSGEILLRILRCQLRCTYGLVEILEVSLNIGKINGVLYAQLCVS